MTTNPTCPNCQRLLAELESLQAQWEETQAQLEQAQAKIAALEAELRRGRQQAAPSVRARSTSVASSWRLKAS